MMRTSTYNSAVSALPLQEILGWEQPGKHGLNMGTVVDLGVQL